MAYKDEMIETAKQIGRANQRKLIEENMALKEEIDWEQVKIDASSSNGVAGAIRGAAAEVSREQWLERTQHMRVVALNEACGLAKVYSNTDEYMSPKQIVEAAQMFAFFLIDGKA